MNRAHGMMRWPTLSSACLAALLVLPGRAAEPVPMGTLSGRLVDPAGRPVANARIWAETTDPRTHSIRRLVDGRTNAEGRFRLGPVEPVYRLRLPRPIQVQADGFVGPRITSGPLTIFPGRDSDLGTIPLERGRSFTGQVLDVDGKPRAGADVIARTTFFDHGHGSAGTIAATTVTTDAEGRFRTSPLPVGQLLLFVQFPDRVRAYFESRPIRPGGDEELGTIRLEQDVPIAVVVKDEDGRPIAGVDVQHAPTDAEGKTSIRGFVRDFQGQIRARKAGFVLIDWGVRRTEKGVYWQEAGGSGTEFGPFGELSMTLKRAGWIEGQAIDADTGAPVRLERVVVRNFERKPSGEVVLRGCRSDFEQTEPGRFRASFPAPDEYHLTFTARGYHDAEAYTPKVTELKTIDGIVARLKKKTEDSTPPVARQTITGSVTRAGQPVQSGWVALWALPRPASARNSPVMRQRTTVDEPAVAASVPIRDGSYSLDVPFQGEAWYVVAEEAGHPLTQVGPVAIALNQKQSLDIACTEGGRIRGRVNDVPPAWAGHLWVVAFSKTAVREEARVTPDGTFFLPPLPPGEYGLKVGHDAYEDAEVYPGSFVRDREHLEAYKTMADPWKRAKVVSVHAGRDTGGVEVALPR